MRKSRFFLCIYLTSICLPALSAAVAQAPLFPSELFRQIFPGSASEYLRAQFITVGIGSRASSHGMRIAMKHRAMQKGQKAAYAFVEQQFKNSDDFFARFFTSKDVQHINKILMSAYNDDGFAPKTHGAFRTEPVFVPREPLLLVQRQGHGVQAIIPHPPLGLKNQNKDDAALFLQWIDKNGSHAWTFVNGVVMPNWKYISTSTPAQLKQDREWTKKYIHIFPPHEPKDLIQAELGSQKALGTKASGGKTAQVVPVNNKLERLLGQQLAEIKTRLAAARKDPAKIVEIAAAAHMSILGLQPFFGAHKRTALVVMNATLRFAGLPAVWFEDGNAYQRAVFEDLKAGGSEKFSAVLRQAIEARKNNG